MAADANVFTIALAAQMLGETEDRLWELADQMDPEDGLVWIHDTNECQTIAFTSFGIEGHKGSYRRSIYDRKLRSRGPRRMLTLNHTANVPILSCTYPRYTPGKMMSWSTRTLNS